MTRVAIVGAAGETAPIGDGRNDAELLGPVIDAALAAAGVSAADIGVLLSASSEFANGLVGSVMDVFDVLPAWPPRTHTHLEGDGAFGLYEAWVRLLAGEARFALVCAYSRPLADDPGAVAALQLDPYTVAPLGVRVQHLAELQARALTGPEILQYRGSAEEEGPQYRGIADAVARPMAAGAAAVVLAVDGVVGERPAAWIAGLDQAVETGAFGARDQTRSASLEAISDRLGLRGTPVDLLEVHAPFDYQQQLAVEAIGLDAATVSGGEHEVPAVSGLHRVVAAARAVLGGSAQRAVAHATNGPCLQHNLLAVLEAGR